MVHFTCDLCGKDLTAAGESRYVVRITAYAGFDPNQITEEDLDDDHMEAISELLRDDDGQAAAAADKPSCKGFRFDLCPSCHGKYLKDPLGRELLRSLDFSQN
ncbi:MAG: hypothetical protein U0800_16265 [Isosphaeraceae bacterium]